MSVNKNFEKELEEYMKLVEPFELPERKSVGLVYAIALIVSVCALAIAIAVLVIE